MQAAVADDEPGTDELEIAKSLQCIFAIRAKFEALDHGGVPFLDLALARGSVAGYTPFAASG